MLKRVAVFASGNGSNFEAIYQAQEAQELAIDIKLLVCNKKDAYAIERAKQKGIEVYMLDYANEEIDELETKLVAKLKSLDIELILLAGFLRKLSSVVINYCPIINIHPSLLPKYKGLHAIERAHENKDEYIGVTIHYVDELLDNGPIIMQDKVYVKDLPLDEAEAKVHAIEHELYVNAIKKVLEES